MQVWLCGGATVRSAPRIVVRDTSVQSCSIMWSCTTAWILRGKIGIGRECHGKTFLSLRKIFRVYLSMISFPNEMSTANFPTFSNHTCTPNSPILTNNGMVSSSKMGFIVALRRRGSCCLSMLDHPFLFNVLYWWIWVQRLRWEGRRVVGDVVR